MVSSAQSVPVAAHAIMEYVMPSLSTKQTETEKQCFLRDPRRDVLSRTTYELQVDNHWGSSIVNCCCDKLVAKPGDGPLLEAFTKQRLVKTVTVRKPSMSIVICEVRRTANA
jgi:hypothetical protein